MGATTITRSDLEAGESRLLEKKDFRNLLLEDVEGKGVVYRDCDFSYSIVVRGYFHKARFERCKFRGTRFVTTIFRSAAFEGCEFSYADFDRCVVPVPQVLANLPAYPNVRWELLHNLRANARSLGDTQHESDLIWREIDTEMEHWRSVYQGQAGRPQIRSATPHRVRCAHATQDQLPAASA